MKGEVNVLVFFYRGKVNLPKLKYFNVPTLETHLRAALIIDVILCLNFQWESNERQVVLSRSSALGCPCVPFGAFLDCVSTICRIVWYLLLGPSYGDLGSTKGSRRDFMGARARL